MSLNLFCPLSLVVAFMLFGNSFLYAQSQGFAGTWRFDESSSRNVAAAFESGDVRCELHIIPEGSNRMVIEDLADTYVGWRKTELNVDLNGPESTSVWPKGDLPSFSFEAVAIGRDQVVKTKAVEGKDRSAFDLTSYFKVLVSQGTYNIVLRSHYQLSANGDTLTVTETRNSREYNEPAVYVFQRVK